MSEKIDLKKTLKIFYQPTTQTPSIVEVPPFNFLMIDGFGDPNTSELYQGAVTTLFQFSYTLKFTVKKDQGINYSVMPLEGLWWMTGVFDAENKDSWQWTAMIAQPEFISNELVENARRQVKIKKAPPLIDQVRFENFHEGLSVQIMHIGPFSDEKTNIERIHSYALNNGYELAGKHHEIYLSDLSRISPEKMKTILRQPIRKILSNKFD
ncbi:MAG: GyrI-like domain-containing protein [Chloroflexota bacterium]